MDGVWANVVDRLPLQDVVRCRRVCRLWHALAGHTLRATTSIDVEVDCPRAIADPQAIASLIGQCGRGLRRLTLRVRARDEKYAVLASECHVTGDVVRAIGRRATSLRSLRIDRMVLTLGAIESFVHLPPTLEELCISNCLMSCSTWDVNTIIQTSLQKLLDNCHRLVTFEITGRGLCFDHFELDTTLMQRLPATIRNLSISAGNSLKIDELSFLQNKRLNSLVLQRSFISSASLPYLVAMADSLEHLDLSWSPNLLDCRLIGQLRNLKCLNLGNNRDGVCNQALNDIVAYCTQLKTLIIDNCSLLTQSSLREIGKLRRLEKLSLSGVSNVDDVVLDNVSVGCSTLAFLDLNFCRKVSSVGILNVLRRLNRLDHLEVLGIRGYNHNLLVKCQRFLRSIVCDMPIQTFSFALPPIPEPAEKAVPAS